MKPTDIARLLLLSALWGGSFLFIRIVAPVFGPIVLVAARVLIAGLALLAYALLTRQSLGIRERWRQYLVLGVVNSAIPFVLISAAELHLTASLAAILNATSPLFGALIAAIWLKDRLVIDVGPVKALTVTFLVPIFGVTWGALFLGEIITLNTVAGCAIILASTALVTGVGLPRAARLSSIETD